MVRAGGQQRATHDEQLAKDEGKEEREHRPSIADNELRLQEHADGHKEERGEKIAKGDDLRQHMAVELRLGDHQPSQEGTKGERETSGLAGEGGPERDQHDRQEEQLA